MNKHYLMSQMKSSGTAYLCWFFLGCHYAYLGKWRLQLLYWITFGGLGIWSIIDLFTIPKKVNAHNLNISQKIDDIERIQRNEEQARKLELINLMSKKTSMSHS